MPFETDTTWAWGDMPAKLTHTPDHEDAWTTDVEVIGFLQLTDFNGKCMGERLVVYRVTNTQCTTYTGDIELLQWDAFHRVFSEFTLVNGG